MKKTLLTIATAAFAAAAFGQGAINMGSTAGGFNTASSNPADPNNADWFTGSVTLEVFSIAAAGNASLAAQINTDEQSKSTVATGVSMITGSWTQQQLGTFGGAASTEANSQSQAVSGGGFVNSGIMDVGTASSLPQTTAVYYALVALASGGREGALVLNNGSFPNGYDPETSPVPSLQSLWATGNQNIILAAPVPEPTTLALAGLGGLSLLALRRRKA